ncbi:MAG: hypothetical protein ACKVOR_03720 [Flavobacteriales bacterium]
MIRSVLMGIGYSAAILALVTLICIVQGQFNLIVGFDFLFWDAKHLHHIAIHGYDFTRTAFFPLFPAIWSSTGLSAGGISILNGLLFLCALACFKEVLLVEKRQFMLLLSIPSVIFFFLPYSEALLFLLSIGFIWSMHRSKLHTTLVFLVLISLTKPTVAILLPAVMIVESNGSEPLGQKLKRMGMFTLAILLGNSLAFLIQYMQTGEWFQFFEAQTAWGNKLSMPNFPLSTWNQPRAIWFDSIAFWFSIVCGCLAGICIHRYYKHHKSIDKLYMYSLLVIAGTGLYVLLFRGGSLFSLNRFVLISPFLFVVLIRTKENFDLKAKPLLLLTFLSFFTVATFFGSYLHIRTLLEYAMLSSLLSIWLYVFFGFGKSSLFYMLISIMALIQVRVVFLVLNGEWIG